MRTWLAEGSTELSPRVFDGVLREVPATSQDRPHWASSRLEMSTLVLGTAAVVTLAVVAMSAGRFGGITPAGPASTPAPTVPAVSAEPSSPTALPVDYAYRDVGFIGLPPLGATPTDPNPAVLIETFWRPGMPYMGEAFLYADGRLIWNEYYPDATKSTGWLQQTLTADGIELVRDLATENAGRPRGLQPETLPGRLPADAWVDATVLPYIPNGFGICIGVSNQENPFRESLITLPEKLAALPTAASDLLRDRLHVPSPDAYDTEHGEGMDCLGMSVADARQLDAALRAAGLEQEEWRNDNLLEYHTVIERPESGTWWLDVWFEPILPDGTITCSSCG